MRVSIVTLAGLCALAIASPGHLEKRQANPSLSSVHSKISSLSAQLAPPTKIAAELTGVPSSVYSVLANPTALASLEAQFVSAPPPWFTSLPADAQAYLLSVAPKYLSIVPEISSLRSAAGLTVAGGSTGTGTAVHSSSGVKMTATSNSTITSSKMSSTSSSTTATTHSSTVVSTSSSSSSSSSSSKASSSSSSAGANPTGVLAAGVMGAVGFLGMALSL